MTREEKIAILKDIIDGEIINPQVRKDAGEWAINILEQEPTEKMHSKTCGTCRHFRKHRNKRNIEICKELYGENTTCGYCTYWEDSYEVALPTTENDYCSHHRGLEE